MADLLYALRVLVFRLHLRKVVREARRERERERTTETDYGLDGDFFLDGEQE